MWPPLNVTENATFSKPGPMLARSSSTTAAAFGARARKGCTSTPAMRKAKTLHSGMVKAPASLPYSTKSSAGSEAASLLRSCQRSSSLAAHGGGKLPSMLVLRIMAGDVSSRQSTDGCLIHASIIVSLSSMDGNFHCRPHGLGNVQSVATITQAAAHKRSIVEMQMVGESDVTRYRWLVN
jgi:hypothetical protein